MKDARPAPIQAGRTEADLRVLAELGVCVHIAVVTPTVVSLRRYRARAEAGQRHPAHNDVVFAAQMESGTKDVAVYRIELPGPGLKVDASDGWTPSLDEIEDFGLFNHRDRR